MIQMPKKKYTKEVVDSIQDLKNGGLSSKEIAKRLNVPLYLVKRNGKFNDFELVRKNIKSGIAAVLPARNESIKRYWNSDEGKVRASERSFKFWDGLESSGKKDDFVRQRKDSYVASGAADRWLTEVRPKAKAAALRSFLGEDESFQAKYNSIAEAHGGKMVGSFVHSKEAVEWECANGHRWMTIPNAVYNGTWCPRCAHVGASRGQLEIADYVKSLGFELDQSRGDGSNKSLIVNPKTKCFMELDVYVPSARFAIEHSGSFCHSDYFREREERHVTKAVECRKAGIRLLAVFDDEWTDKKELVKAMIRHRLGVLPAIKVRASKCQLRKLSHNVEFAAFFDRNHLDGHARANVAYGLFLEGRLVSCLSIRTNHQSEIEIARFATDYDVHIYGAASKLVTAALSDYEEIITFSNNRLSTGDVYSKLGAALLQENPPSYWYTDGHKRIWRTKCVRINDPDILAKFPEVPHTEKDQARAGVIGFKLFGKPTPLYKVEDYGHRKWIIRRP
jgi:hypothetical protein